MNVEMPKLELLKFDLPKVEVPEAYREFAEKSLAQVKDGYEKIKTAAEEATDRLANSYATGADGFRSFGLKVIDGMRANSNAAFDLFGILATAKSYAEVIELSSGYVRQQFEAVTEQTKGLAECAQKVMIEASEPVKEGFASAFHKAA
jgi:phasin